jgi:hypothetical protein
MKLEVFRVLLSCILVIDRLFRRSAYGFETVSVSIAASNLSLLICWVTQHNKIFSILFCCCLNWLNHVFLTHSQVACRCSELVWFFFQFTINLILTLHSETIKILLFVLSVSYSEMQCAIMITAKSTELTGRGSNITLICCWNVMKSLFLSKTVYDNTLEMIHAQNLALSGFNNVSWWGPCWTLTYLFTSEIVILQKAQGILLHIILCCLQLSIIMIAYQCSNSSHEMLTKLFWRCHTTMNVSRIPCNYECMFTLQASDSVGFSFTPDCLCSEWSLNNLAIFLHASLILSLSHCLFVSDHDVLSGPAWPLIIHVLIYDRVIATTGHVLMWSRHVTSVVLYLISIELNQMNPHHSQCLNHHVNAIESELSLNELTNLNRQTPEETTWSSAVLWWIYSWLWLLMFSHVEHIILDDSYLKCDWLSSNEFLEASSLVTSCDACLTS